MIGGIVAQMGGSDCESIGTGVFAQPINTVSSLAYTVIGVFVLGWAFAVSGRERTYRLVFGVLMGSTGIGSVLFHGPQIGTSQFTHDVTFLVTLWFLAVGNLADRFQWSSTRRWTVTVVGSVAVAATLLLSPPTTNVVMVVGVLVLVTSDVLLRRHGRVVSMWFVASFITIGLAVVMFLLGRTGSPLCDPGAFFQGHAVWHLLGAVSLGSYFVGTSHARLDPTQEK
ncbi:MAG: hypothetical protein M3094_01415 [Actinomycetia bacterium]|nr:hypothetical protein [Actinomycetes bacterium]